MQFHIILVSPARAENVGAVARAMKTMGFSSLRIVNSQIHMDSPAQWVAHGATDLLQTAQCFTNLEDALKDVDFTIMSTARSRARFQRYCSPVELSEQLGEKKEWLQNIALVFGPEDSGLSNEDLDMADILTGIPMAVDYPSLNLGQAVMVYCYQLSPIIQHVKLASEAELIVKETAEGQLNALRKRLNRLLTQLDVDDDKILNDWLMQRIGYFTQRDTAMLHTFLHDIEKKILSIK